MSHQKHMTSLLLLLRWDGLNEKSPSWAQVPGYPVSTWWHYGLFGKVVEPLGGGALLEEVPQGVGLGVLVVSPVSFLCSLLALEDVKPHLTAQVAVPILLPILLAMTDDYRQETDQDTLF